MKKFISLLIILLLNGQLSAMSEKQIRAKQIIDTVNKMSYRSVKGRNRKNGNYLEEIVLSEMFTICTGTLGLRNVKKIIRNHFNRKKFFFRIRRHISKPSLKTLNHLSKTKLTNFRSNIRMLYLNLKANYPYLINSQNRLRRAEEDRLEEDRLRQAKEDRRRRARRRRAEKDRRRRAEEDRRRQDEEDRRRRAEEDRRRQDEEDRLRRDEEDRLRRDEEDRLRRDEEDRQRRAVDPMTQTICEFPNDTGTCYADAIIQNLLNTIGFNKHVKKLNKRNPIVRELQQIIDRLETKHPSSLNKLVSCFPENAGIRGYDVEFLKYLLNELNIPFTITDIPGIIEGEIIFIPLLKLIVVAMPQNRHFSYTVFSRIINPINPEILLHNQLLRRNLPNFENIHFNLIGINKGILYHGKNIGHALAYIKKRKDSCWWECNDERIERIGSGSYGEMVQNLYTTTFGTSRGNESSCGTGILFFEIRTDEDERRTAEIRSQKLILEHNFQHLGKFPMKLVYLIPFLKEKFHINLIDINVLIKRLKNTTNAISGSTTHTKSITGTGFRVLKDWYIERLMRERFSQIN